jgi:tetratricopeptide (TPR) repeat protein
MNRFFTSLILSTALTFVGQVHAKDRKPPATVGNTDTVIQPYRQASPEAELIYHIMLGEVAGSRGQLDTALENFRQAALASPDPRVAERAMGIALFAQDKAAMLAIAERWYALDKTSNKALQAMVLALLNNERVAEAIPHLEALRLTADQDGQEGFTVIAALLDQIQDKALAIKVMDGLRALHPASRFAQYYYALAGLEGEDYPSALQALDTVLQRDSQWGAAYLLQARVRMAMGDDEAALAGLAKAVDTLPDDRTLRIGYARLLVGAERLDEARTQFERLAQRDPKDVDALYALGLLASEQKRYDDAVKHFTQLVEQGERVMDAYFELGRVEELRGDFAKAKDWYARVENDERYLSAQVRMGVMLAKQGDFSGMAEHFGKVRQNNPQSWVVLYISEAEILRDEKRHQSAYDLLTQALAQEPNDENLLYSRALAAERLDRLDVLESDLRGVIEANPENGHALNALGYTLADRTDRYQEALGYIERAIALLPDDPAVIDSMGWVQFRLGNHEEALKYLRRAYKINADAEIAAHLTEVLWVTNQQEEARKIWQTAVEKDPDSEHLRKIKERLGL